MEEEVLHWLEVPQGTRFLPFKEIPFILAELLCPLTERDPDGLSQALTALRLEEELARAVLLDDLQVMDTIGLPLRFTHGDALARALVSIPDLRRYLTRLLRIGVRYSAPASATSVPVAETGKVLAGIPTRASQAAEKEAREDARLAHCEAEGLIFDKAALLRLPYGIAKAAASLDPPITRQSLSTDVKAALRRRFERARTGKG